MSKRQRQRARKAAKRLPAHMQDVAFSKAVGKRWRRRNGGLGSFGPASEVRRIDPASVATKEIDR